MTKDKQEPYVRLRLTDTPYSRAMWDHAFELEYEVVLGARDLQLTLTARNCGATSFAFTAALHSYFGVLDVREESVLLLVRARGRADLRKVGVLLHTRSDNNAVTTGLAGNALRRQVRGPRAAGGTGGHGAVRAHQARVARR